MDHISIPVLSMCGATTNVSRTDSVRLPVPPQILLGSLHSQAYGDEGSRGPRLAPIACCGTARPFQVWRASVEGEERRAARAVAGRHGSKSDTPSRPPPCSAGFERRCPHLNGNSLPPGGAFFLAQPVNPCREEGGASPRQQRPAPGTGPAMLLSRT